MRPELVREFVAEYHRQLSQLTATASAERIRQEPELARTERELRAIIDAIKSGITASSMQQELLALEARKAELARCLQETGPKLVRMTPRLADLYREKVAHLHAELNRDPIRSEAASVLR